MKLNKAIIAVAGYGTRRLPITKSLEKCMLPIGNRPVVDYLVEDCIKAGIRDIIFVVGEQHEQIKHYYSETNKPLEAYLEEYGKTAELQQVRDLVGRATFRYVVQDRHHPRGTSVPVALCADLVEDGEQVLFLAGDDFVYNPTGESGVVQLIQAVQERQATSGILSIEVPRDEVGSYGVIELHEGAFVRIVEKPKPNEAPSNLINISKYIFDKDMVRHAVTSLDYPAANGECQIIDALNMYAADGKKAIVVPAEGEYLDGGSLQGWLHANNAVMGNNI